MGYLCSVGVEKPGILETTTQDALRKSQAYARFIYRLDILADTPIVLGRQFDKRRTQRCEGLNEPNSPSPA